MAMMGRPECPLCANFVLNIWGQLSMVINSVSPEAVWGGQVEHNGSRIWRAKLMNLICAEIIPPRESNSPPSDYTKQYALLVLFQKFILIKVDWQFLTTQLLPQDMKYSSKNRSKKRQHLFVHFGQDSNLFPSKETHKEQKKNQFQTVKQSKNQSNSQSHRFERWLMKNNKYNQLWHNRTEIISQKLLLPAMPCQSGDGWIGPQMNFPVSWYWCSLLETVIMVGVLPPFAFSWRWNRRTVAIFLGKEILNRFLNHLPRLAAATGDDCHFVFRFVSVFFLCVYKSCSIFGPGSIRIFFGWPEG